MTAFVQNLGRHTGSRHVTRQIASDNRTGANAGFAMHGNVVHDVTARTDVDFVSYMCRARQIGTNRGELSDVYIVSNDSMAVNDNAKTMLNVKTISYLYPCRNEDAIFPFISVQHQLCKGI